MEMHKCIGDYFEVAIENEARVTAKKVAKLLKQQEIKPRKPVVRCQPNRGHAAIYAWINSPTIQLKTNARHPEILAVIIKVLNGWGYNVKILRNNQAALLFDCPKIFR